MKNIVYDHGAFCYVGTIIGGNLKITRHCKAGGLTPWGNTFRKSLILPEGITALNALKEFAKGDAA